MSALYLVATPIGNLEDITGRAVRILGEVDLILAEDTRRTRKLLTYYNLQTPLLSYHEHSNQSKLDEALAALSTGNVALVSDAGTPVMNDPGYELVRAALQAGHIVSPIPGPSAPIAAISASGLPTDAFLYLGYTPRKAGDRRRLLEEIARLPYTLIFLETPHRLIATLQDLQRLLGDRTVAVARELTKLHEEIYRGRLSEALEHFCVQPPRGEFTLVIAGASQEPVQWDSDRLRDVLKDYLEQGEPPSSIAAQVAAQSGWPRRDVYRILTELDRES